ncbi:MAG: enoyl-CoA hydratase/isomerase family protein [candidate division Zixibacteria bacterium]|nr:enoyl-CoA hydratase/isomerase family protein [candidate division Zixibacteria bacterium]
MNTTQVSIDDSVAILTLARDKVNAINETLIDDINNELDSLEANTDIDAIVLTGREKFFSFGFDVPELLTLSEEGLRRFLTKHTALLLRLFTFSKPIIAAVNGHATAGGCMLMLACDFRVAAEGRAKIGLNEIDLGVSVFGGSAEMLRYWAGNWCAETILKEGKLYSVVQAANLGMIDAIVPPDRLMSAATDKAREFGGKPKAAYRAIKRLMRGGLADRIALGEEAALDAFIETWYTEEAQTILKSLQIRK